MAKKATPTIIPDENLDAEIGITPVETVILPNEIKIEFKQETFNDLVRFTKVFENLSREEAINIHAALVANFDKQPETKIFLFLRSLEEMAIKTNRATFKE